MYQQRKTHCDEVVDKVASRLQSLDAAHLPLVAQRMATLPSADAPEIDVTTKDFERLARQIAVCMVKHHAAIAVVSCLVALRQTFGGEDAAKMAGIVDFILPLNYAPHVIQRLREAVGEQRLGWVEGEVSTRTLAEVIMAGFDQQPTTFATVTATQQVRGQVAFDYVDVPEEGPSEPGDDRALRKAVRNFMHDLVALKSHILSGEAAPLLEGRHQQRPDADLDREITGYAKQLRGALKGLSAIHVGRTIYCVLAPPSDVAQRVLRKQMLHMVHDYIPELMFVELVPLDQANEDEFQVEVYVQACLTHI